MLPFAMASVLHSSMFILRPTKNYSWKSYSSIVSDYTQGNSIAGIANVSYYGSWRPIKGSKSWWAEINPEKVNVVAGGVSTPHYYPCAQLILYYEYPGVDIFSSDFAPYLRIRPGDMLPCPSGTMLPNKEQKLPLNQSRLQMAWNPWWRPILTNSPLVVELFEKAKEDFTAWPVDHGKTLQYGSSSGKYECDSGQDKSDDAERHGEPGSLLLDHSV